MVLIGRVPHFSVVGPATFRLHDVDSFYCRDRESTGMGNHLYRYSELQNHNSADGLHRYELQDRYLELTRHSLPAIARLKGWRLKEGSLFHACDT